MAFEITPGFLFFSDENRMSFDIKEIIYNTNDPHQIEERDKAISFLLMAIDFYKKGRFNKALDFIDFSLEIFKKYSELSYGIGLFFLGELYEIKEDWQKSLENYQKSKEILEKYNHRMSWDADKKIKKVKEEIER